MVSMVTDLFWVLTTLRHASRLLEVVPECWCSAAIPIGILISSVCGSIVNEERRWPWPMKLPPQLAVLVGFFVLLEYSHEVFKEFSAFASLLPYLYSHFCFWVFLSLKATDISQVLVPMFLLVKPSRCVIFLVGYSFSTI